jgi:hypothetical protein
MRAVFA